MQQAQLPFDGKPAAKATTARFMGPQMRPPRLLVPWSSFWPSFLENLFDFVARREVPEFASSSAPGRFWADVFVQRPMPWKELGESVILHAAAIALTALYGNLWLVRKHVEITDPVSHTTISYYKTEDFLPAVETPPAKAASRAQSKADPVKAAQEIVSVPSDPDNSEQMIANLTHPEILRNNAPLPNMVISAPAKFSATAPSLVAPVLAFKPMTPQIEHVSEAAIEKVDAHESAVDVPVERAPQIDAAKLQVAQSARKVEIPQPNAPAAPREVASGFGNSSSAQQLLVLNARPSMPSELNVPDGSRKGIFATSPGGREGAAGTPGVDANVRLLPEIAGGGRVPGANGSGAGEKGPGTLPDGITVTGPEGTKLASAITDPTVRVQKPMPKVMLPAPSVRPVTTVNLPRTTAPPLDDIRRREDDVFGRKRVYTMQINLPNLTSAGGSWVIRFAELDGNVAEGELSTPVAVTKVDPAYPPSLQQDGIQGTVVLYALIHTDGTVGDIRVLHGLEDRLDESAMKALSRWRFRPARKSGTPVDIEAVVQIPFYARKAGY
jgi:TonB family protein